MASVVRRVFKIVIPLGLLALLLAGVLFSGYATTANAPGWLRQVSVEIQAACRDAGTQWMVVVCLLSYFITFLILERRVLPQRATKGAKETVSTPHPDAPGRGGEGGALALPNARAISNLLTAISFPTFWLVALLVLVLLRYAVDYANAAKSLQVVVLLTGMVIGKGMALWAAWAKRPLTPSLSPSDGERVSAGRVRGCLGSLVFLLAASALWQADIGMEFFYRGIRRWEGVWDNPNTYGVLMGTGLTLALGLLVASSRFQVPSGKQNLTARVSCYLWFPALLAVAGMCGFGLLRSYSRGAWLGTAWGVGLLVWKWINREPYEPRENREQQGRNPLSRIWSISRFMYQVRLNWLPLLVLLISILTLSFWQFRQTEAPLLRRLFSAGNVNDFSWRNRVTAWQGAGRMLWDKPLAGFGWGQAEEAYRKDYRAARLEEAAAIQLNDYLMVGISAGLPALVCWLVYLLLCLRGPGVESRETAALSTINFPPATIAASGATVLLLGFWFDGGLFKLPTCVVFWVLLELARAPLPALSPPDGERVVARPGEGVSLAKRARRSGALRWLAGIMGLAALGLTSLHLGTPQLAVNERTLSLARQWLVPPREQADFEYLAARNIWSGQPLKVLLAQVELANYNRTLVNWKLEDQVYREYVLSPEVDPAFDGDMNWRRPLWEYFYPRIRKETSLEAAAGIVGRQLRERVRISEGTNVSTDMKTIWQRQIATTAALERVYVAALRAAGIPARLSVSSNGEFWDGARWKPLPRGDMAPLP